MIHDIKVLKKKKFDKDLVLLITKHERGERIFVEFSSKEAGRMVQKSFQDNFKGRTQAESFENSIKSMNDFVKYFERS